MIFFFLFSALESPTVRSSPSLYEGAFRLETTARPSDMFTAGAMLLATPPKQQDDSIAEDEDDDSLSSPPVDESYKIRIGPTMGLHHNRGGSLSPPPRSHEGEDEEEEDDETERRQQQQRHEALQRHTASGAIGGGMAQDLSVTSSMGATAPSPLLMRSCGPKAEHPADGGDESEGGHHGGGYHSEESDH
jgi:hypothetical protein